ncbi:MAG: TIGR03118 family protein, partial [Chloroflexi bacterium]
FYQQTNLVSDLDGVAKFKDAHLVNPWGLVHGPATPWWISDNGAGVSTLYDGNGNAFPSPPTGPLVVTVPPPRGAPAGTLAAPTGVVFNGTTGFVVSKGGKSGAARFIFSTEDGTISGWNPAVDPTNAILAVDRSAVGAGAVYKGLAIGSNEDGTFLYATNFRFGNIEMFDANFHLVRSFTDHDLPNGYAPFGIQNIGGNLYVTFALQDAAKHDDVAGQGHGFVDVFDTSGHLIRRLVSHGQLNSPWGLALAPANFGRFSNDLLVGNFGNGRINAYDPKTGERLGQLKSQAGDPIVIDGLWALEFGNDATAGPSNVLFFTAGIDGEMHGLFGRIQSVS